jgi:glycosyltransferase involved in cell wall biosynthesis
MKISVCVPVSRPDTVNATIQSIRNQTWTDWELIAVGQGSSEIAGVNETRKIVNLISEEDERVRYIHINKRGSSRAKNAAIRSAQGEIIAAIDDDAEASPDWLETMANYFSEHNEIDVLGGAVIKPPKMKRGLAVCPTNDPKDAVYDPKTMDDPPLGWEWIGCNLGFRKWVVEKVGLYDEYLGPGCKIPATEDTDLKLRLEAMNIKMATTPKLIVNHTYGYRYGLKAYIKHQYNYAYGNGGLAGKLTLAGDPRGKEWYWSTRRERLLGWIKPFRPHKFIIGLLGWQIFRSAYQYCIKEFRVENNLLVPR